MTPIQTLEILDAAISASRRYQADMVDGKQSWLERLAWLGEIPEVRQAIDGAGQVDDELVGLTPAGEEMLRSRIVTLLGVWGMRHRVQDITTEVVKATINLFRSVMVIIRLPVSAEAV